MTKRLDLAGVSDAVRILGVSRTHVLRLVADGQLEPVGAISDGLMLVFDKGDVESLADSREKARKARLAPVP